MNEYVVCGGQIDLTVPQRETETGTVDTARFQRIYR